jgi:excisionase family DNA binding protein
MRTVRLIIEVKSASNLAFGAQVCYGGRRSHREGPMVEIPLSELGLMTVAEACAAKGWSARAVQKWVQSGLLPAAVVGPGRTTFLLRKADVEKFVPPPRGRPRASE